MGVELASTVQALLPQPILPAKLGFVFAVATFSAVVVFQASRAFSAENPVPDPLAALRARVAGRHVTVQVDRGGHGRRHTGGGHVITVGELGAAFGLLVCGLNVSAGSQFFLGWAVIRIESIIVHVCAYMCDSFI